MNQHSNPDNPRAHRLTTGPELYHQCHVMTGQPPAEFVTGLGSGGTAFGVAMFREDIGATFKIIGVEPAEASLLTGGTFHPHGFSGIAPGFIPPIWQHNMHRLDGIETVTKEEGWALCRRMLVEEGVLIGPSSGASIFAALRRARLPENKGKAIVTIAHDRGDRYLDVPGLFEPPPEASEEDVEGKE
jgi:cysteine synthase A